MGFHARRLRAAVLRRGIQTLDNPRRLSYLLRRPLAASFMSKSSILPFLVLGGGFAWYLLLEWLRRRPSLQPRDGNSPGTQYLMVLGASGLLLCVIAAGIIALKVWR